ncbi:MAG: hypothetical protein Q4F41_15700 [Eubacteriales bacterium]|nr:hypothetical protein [Eubacteriales bacterium]
MTGNQAAHGGRRCSPDRNTAYSPARRFILKIGGFVHVRWHF